MSVNVKEEVDRDVEEVVEPPAFGPAALGLHRVGTKLPPKPVPSQPIQVLNARGMPARIRKKNKLFFDDDIVNERPPRTSPKRVQKPILTKSPTRSPAKKRKLMASTKFAKIIKEEPKDYLEEESKLTKDEPENALDKKTNQRLGYKLRNLLKLPKAHKFVSYEWFYSNIDKPLFDGETDFQICLKESFPQLNTMNLTRIEWTKIRRLMGKPRRCSPSFFEEERRELERKRQKIRLLQTRKFGDISFVKDLPKEISVPLSVGCKVTARLRRPQDGLFSGIVDAVDPVNNTYRITFDRVGLGPQSIPDYEVLSNDPPETIPLSSLTLKFRPKNNIPLYVASSLQSALSVSKGDPFLISNSQAKKVQYPKEQIGGFSLKLLEVVIRTKKSLAAKQTKLLRLKEMNTEAEMYKSYGENFPEDFQRKYAGIVIGMEKLNRDMQEYLNQVQGCCKQLVREPLLAAMITPTYLREKCRQMGEETFRKNNNNIISDGRMTTLISNLAMIMWVASNLSNSDDNTQVLHVIEACIEDVKNKLDSENIEVFQKNVQIHLHHIQLELRHMISNNTNV